MRQTLGRQSFFNKNDANNNEEMGPYKNSHSIKVTNEAPKQPYIPTKLALTKGAKIKLAVRNNILVIFFFMVWTAAFGYILYSFFPIVHQQANRYIGRQFKRPLPKEPEKYFDVACTNIHSYETFMKTNQAQLCHDARPLSGTPVFFGIGAPASGEPAKSS